MIPTPVPTRITIDFRQAVEPSRSWILGVDDVASSSIRLHAFATPPERPASMPAVAPASLVGACTCPDFCNLDHANE